MGTKTPLRAFVFCFLSFAGSFAFSAEIDLDATGALTLSGKITGGDADRIEELVLEDPQRFIAITRIYLDSPGGSVMEATAIGEMLERYKIAAIVNENDYCASACALIYIAAPARIAIGDVAMHRPYLLAEMHEEASVAFTIERQKTAINTAKKFMEERNVPEHLIEKMINTPSDSAYVLTPQDKDRMGYFSAPWQEIIIARKCDYSDGTDFTSADFSSKVRCSIDAGKITRYEYLRNHVSPEIAREAFRAHALSIGGKELPDGRIVTDDGSQAAQDIQAEPSKPNGSDGLSVQKDESDSRLTRGGPLGKYSLDQLLNARERAAEAKDDAAVEQLDGLIDSKRQELQMEKNWLEVARRAKDKGIAFEDPGGSMERLMLMMNELLPQLAARGDADAALALGDYLEKIGQLEGAISRYQQAAELGNAYGLLYLATIYELTEEENLIKAIAYYSLAIERISDISSEDPKDRWVFDARAAIHSQLSDLEKSQAELFKAMTESKLPVRGLQK